MKRMFMLQAHSKLDAPSDNDHGVTSEDCEDSDSCSDILTSDDAPSSAATSDSDSYGSIAADSVDEDVDKEAETSALAAFYHLRSTGYGCKSSAQLLGLSAADACVGGSDVERDCNELEANLVNTPTPSQYNIPCGDIGVGDVGKCARCHPDPPPAWLVSAGSVPGVCRLVHPCHPT
jgi:hypothetical protein